MKVKANTEMNRKKAEKKVSYKLFGLLFLLIFGIMIVSNFLKTDMIALEVPNNPGVSFLETVNDRLVCVYHNGQTVVWDWNGLPQQLANFPVGTNRVILLNSEQLATVNETDKKILSVYDLLSGNSQKDITVGWADQQVWPCISFNKAIIALIRKNTPDPTGRILYEFLTVDMQKELLGVPVSLTLNEKTESLIDYAVDGDSILYVAGAKGKVGYITAINLKSGIHHWDRSYDRTKEFCSVMVSPDNNYLLAGNRDGILYKIDSINGEVINKIVLLQESETRPVTNDVSVLNLTFSPDGQYFASTIIPKVYLMSAESCEAIYIGTPANRLLSRVAFSPDNRFFATSDLRQGYPIKVWDMPD